MVNGKDTKWARNSPEVGFGEGERFGNRGTPICI